MNTINILALYGDYNKLDTLFVEDTSRPSLYDVFDVLIAHRRYDLVINYFDKYGSPLLRGALMAKVIGCIAILSSNGSMSRDDAQSRLSHIDNVPDLGSKVGEMCVNAIILDWLDERGIHHDISADDVQWLHKHQSHVLYPTLTWWWRYNKTYLELTRLPDSTIPLYHRKLYTLDELHTKCIESQQITHLVGILLSLNVVTQDDIDMVGRLLIEDPSQTGKHSFAYINPIMGSIYIPQMSLDLFCKRVSRHKHAVAVDIIVSNDMMSLNRIKELMYNNDKAHLRVGVFTKRKMDDYL